MSTKPRKTKDKEANTSYNEPKCHIVILGKRTIVGLEAEIYMSEYYNKFDEIPPFKVNTDPSILLNDEYSSWLWRNHKQGTYAKTKSYTPRSHSGFTVITFSLMSFRTYSWKLPLRTNRRESL
ncbi:hypothetical protein D1007_61798 [Hordeum vulgare]|nr:hypothetical protein D1007_61798 [Hordeum vulgare]